MTKINLNADLGESFGAYRMGDDERLLQSISSANIACGFHAGDPVVMQKTVACAIEHKVSVGAHPGYPDLQGFGRRAMNMSQEEVYAMVVYQIGALSAFAATMQAKVSHVKPHGALSTLACEDAELAEVISRAVKAVDRELILLAPALSELSTAGKKTGLCVAEEMFADRAYTDKGTLLSRKIEGSVIHDAKECLERTLEMVERGGLITHEGKLLKTEIHSICVHGDTPQACESAAYIKAGLQENGLQVVPLDQMEL